MRSVLRRLSDSSTTVLWLTIKSAAILVVEAKFGGDSDFVANRCERFSNKFFICIWAVDLGCIEECDAFFTGCTNDLNALVSVCGGSVVGANAHAPKSHFRDF